MSPEDFDFDDDPARIDRDTLWKFLSEQAYWGKGRTRTMFETQLDRAWRVVGAYDRATGRLVGFARADSDGGPQAYLADVFIDDSARGHGLGKRIVHVMIEEGPGRDFRWMLHTNDAHGLYRKFGFADPDPTFMQRASRLPGVRD